MSSIITELDQFDATVTVPDDGDTAGAASVTAAGVGFQVLANRTRFLKNLLSSFRPSSHQDHLVKTYRQTTEMWHDKIVESAPAKMKGWIESGGW